MKHPEFATSGLASSMIIFEKWLPFCTTSPGQPSVFDSPLDNRAAVYDPEAGNPLIRFGERDVEPEAW